MARSYQGSLVAHVGNVGTREARSLAGKQFHIDRRVGFLALEVYVEHGLALAEVGQVNVYLAVEAPGTEQGLVEHIHAVGGCQHYHAAVGAEAVHLGKQGIEGVLALVVAAHGGVL